MIEELKEKLSSDSLSLALLHNIGYELNKNDVENGLDVRSPTSHKFCFSNFIGNMSSHKKGKAFRRTILVLRSLLKVLASIV